jgi:threonine/homoserine/homoserine lactone efflux protein|tara:strand:+ start:2530 stop:3108 length:579 start_codon:yes stop_codon:yes gene_type:complete
MAPVLTFAMTAAITPGPNNIILSTNAVNYGFKETIPLMMGVFFGFLSVLTLCLLGIGELYKSFPAIAMIVKIVATCFLVYLSFRIFTSSSFSDEKNSKKFSFKDIYFFQIINPKAVTVSMSSSAIFIQNKFSYQIEFILIFLCFVISTSTSAIAWAAIGHSFRKYLDDKKKIVIFNRIMAVLLLMSISFIIL